MILQPVVQLFPLLANTRLRFESTGWLATCWQPGQKVNLKRHRNLAGQSFSAGQRKLKTYFSLSLILGELFRDSFSLFSRASPVKSYSATQVGIAIPKKRDKKMWTKPPRPLSKLRTEL